MNIVQFRTAFISTLVDESSPSFFTSTLVKPICRCVSPQNDFSTNRVVLKNYTGKPKKIIMRQITTTSGGRNVVAFFLPVLIRKNDEDDSSTRVETNVVRDHTTHTHTYYLCCTGLMVAYIGNKLTAYRILRSICILTLRRTRISKNVLSLPLFFLVFFSLSHSLHSFYLFFILHYTVRRVTYFNFTLSLSLFFTA